MVQIVNSLIIAAAVVPALAAPVLDSREPRFGGLKVAGKIAGKVASGISLGATVAPLLSQRDLEVEEFDAREPRITSAQAKSWARTAGKIGSHAQSGIEFGAAVAPLLPHRQRRSIEDLETRKFHVSKSSLKAAGGVAAGAAGFAGTVALMNSQPRDLEEAEIDARDPKFRIGSIFKTVGKVAGNFIRDDETGDIYIRDYDDAELDARDPGLNPIFRHVSKKVDTNFIRVREDAELDARDPKFRLGSVFKTVGKIAGNFIRETPEIDSLD